MANSRAGPERRARMQGRARRRTERVRRTQTPARRSRAVRPETVWVPEQTTTVREHDPPRKNSRVPLNMIINKWKVWWDIWLQRLSNKIPINYEEKESNFIVEKAGKQYLVYVSNMIIINNIKTVTVCCLRWRNEDRAPPLCFPSTLHFKI